MIDLTRKIFLTSMVLFIDQQNGSAKLQRLVVAAIVSAMFATILALARPYRRSDNLYLACLANLLLTCCFCAGLVIQARATLHLLSVNLPSLRQSHPLPWPLQLCESNTYENMCYVLYMHCMDTLLLDVTSIYINQSSKQSTAIYIYKYIVLFIQ